MELNDIYMQLRSLDTACLCDANKEIRALEPAIRPIRSDLKLMGRAFTVRCRDDFLTVIKALQEAEPGDVLVVDGQGGHRALAGELFSTEAERKGIAGIVVDGAVRDIETIRKLDVPVYSRYVFPISGTTSKVCDLQIPVTCGGVTVNPGDILFGDQDGVIVASENELIEMILVR